MEIWRNSKEAHVAGEIKGERTRGDEDRGEAEYHGPR